MEKAKEFGGVGELRSLGTSNLHTSMIRNPISKKAGSQKLAGAIWVLAMSCLM